MTEHERFMQRCLQLALLGEGNVAPNPMVGSVLVYEGRIIGEGYHARYGMAHAEVHCINSVSEEDKILLSRSTLYVSLEPCAHYGKTPPCADLIIANNIPKVVVGCRDPFVQVAGKGIEKLRRSGIEVTVGVLESACMALNKRFFLFHTLHRPYIHLKWAETLNRKVGSSRPERLLISSAFTNRVVHKWRMEEMAILVGTNTVNADDPELTNRLWPGGSPVRLVIDRELKLPEHAKVLNHGPLTLVFNLQKHTLPLEKLSVTDLRDVKTGFYQVTADVSLVHQILNACYQFSIHSILVEGGSYLLQSFIDEAVWDEATVITNEQMLAEGGLPAPTLKGAQLERTDQWVPDTIRTYRRAEIP